jgi:hypothetical protein
MPHSRKGSGIIFYLGGLLMRRKFIVIPLLLLSISAATLGLTACSNTDDKKNSNSDNYFETVYAEAQDLGY